MVYGEALFGESNSNPIAVDGGQGILQLGELCQHDLEGLFVP